LFYVFASYVAIEQTCIASFCMGPWEILS
jgi:hypothetical protein